MESWLNGSKKILVVTGAVNSGKSTITKKIVDSLLSSGKNVKGFLSKGIFSGEDKTSYKLINISTKDEHHFASIHPKKNFNLKQGRFYFDEDIFEQSNKWLLKNSDCEIIVVDEIGHLELKVKGFFIPLKNSLTEFEGKIIMVVRENLIKDILEKFNLSQKEIEILRIENYQLWKGYY